MPARRPQRQRCVALRYYGAGKERAATLRAQLRGFGVGAAQNGGAAGWSIFYVAQGADGEGEVALQYTVARNGWGADAIIRGVDAFQVLYGLETDTRPTERANRYVNASAFEAYDAALVLEGADAAARQRDLHRRTHWKRVASVRVALLLHGEAGQADKLAELGPAQFDLFGKAYAEAHGAGDTGVRIARASLPAATRSRLRQLVQTSIMLRNGPPRRAARWLARASAVATVVPNLRTPRWHHPRVCAVPAVIILLLGYRRRRWPCRAIRRTPASATGRRVSGGGEALVDARTI